MKKQENMFPHSATAFAQLWQTCLASEMSLGSYTALAVDTAAKSHPPLLSVSQNIYFSSAGWANFIHN